MIWLTWRQLRLQAAVVYAAVGGFVVLLAVTGPRLPTATSLATSLYDQLTGADRMIYYAGLFAVALAPAVIGAFWGAPLVARELETGTHRLVWNQSISRARWLATKLGLTMIAGAAAVAVLGLVVTRWAQALDGVQSSTRGSLPSRLTPVAFAMRGVAPIGYVVFALALGVTAGAVIRRVVPAMAVTLAVFVAVQVLVPHYVRPHLLPPTRQSVTITQHNLIGVALPGPGQPVQVLVKTGDRGDWILSDQTVDAAGRPVSLPSWAGDCLGPTPGSVSSADSGTPDAGSAAGSGTGAGSQRRAAPAQSCLTKLAGLGYRQRVVYQPASRFWPLQWTETALFLALSALLSCFCFWWTKRRLS